MNSIIFLFALLRASFLGECRYPNQPALAEKPGEAKPGGGAFRLAGFYLCRATNKLLPPFGLKPIAFVCA